MIFDYTRTYGDNIHIIAGQTGSGKTRKLIEYIKQNTNAYNVIIDIEGGIIRYTTLQDLKGIYYGPHLNKHWLNMLTKDIPRILEKSKEDKKKYCL